MSELTTESIQTLLDAARAVRERAYVPYSGFDAGAAVLTADGALHPGALVENLVFGLAMCAERVAMFTAIAAGSRLPVAMALVAPSTAGRLTYPCGSCLQVAVELGGSDMAIIAGRPSGDDYEVTTLHELAPGLPHRTRPAN